jgi:hypothetical protein
VLLEAIDQAGGSCTQLALFNHVHDRLPVGNRRTPVLLEDLIGETLARLFDQRAIGTSGTAERRRYFRRAA